MGERRKKKESTSDCKTADELAALCAEIAEDHKSEDVVRLKISELSVIADYLVLCTGNSVPHVRAIADHIYRELRNRFNIRAFSIDGVPASQWMVLDYGNVIVHVFTPEIRDIYQLESLWGDAQRD